MSPSAARRARLPVLFVALLALVAAAWVTFMVVVVFDTFVMFVVLDTFVMFVVPLVPESTLSSSANFTHAGISVFTFSSWHSKFAPHAGSQIGIEQCSPVI
jgi:hypothetical protein